MVSILCFPPEICTHIFSYLSAYDKLNAKSVCSYWRGVLEEHQKLWSHLDFGRFVKEKDSLTDSGLYSILTTLKARVRYLSLFFCTELTGWSLLRVCENSKKLTSLSYLNLSWTNVSDHVIFKLLKLLPHLIHLDLGENSNVTDVSTIYVAALEQLKFLRCSSVHTTSYTINIIVNAATFLGLEELNIRGIPLPRRKFSEILNKFKSLRILKVTFCHSFVLNELVAALDPKTSSTPCHLEQLCVCDDIEAITSDIIKTLQSFGISICDGRLLHHSYCYAEFEHLKFIEANLVE